MGKIALVNGLVFDSTGKPVFKGNILINEGKIEKVGKANEMNIPDEYEIIDLKNKFVMPGMIDAHLHLTGSRSGKVEEDLITPIGVFFARAIKDLESIINAGFTTVVDAGSIIAVQLKEAINEKTIIGPRIIAAGPVLSQTFGHGDTHYLPIEYVDYRTTRKLTPFMSLICDGTDECRKATRYAFREGADFIKVMASGGVLSQRDRPEYRQFTLEELKAIVDEANAVGKWVHSHAEGKIGIINSAKAGVKVIAHGDMMDEEAANEVLKAGSVVIPTFAIDYALLEKGSELGVPEWGMKKIKELYEIHVENAKLAYKMGIKLATGTDYSGGVGKHGDNAMELKLFVEKVGMKNEEALISSTKIASEATGLEKLIGTIEKGKLADLIVINGNPLDDINVLLNKENIQLVMKEGEIYKNKLT
ncbi:MAG: amidohydrolase family protein [Caldisphaera sp.]|jgi:imidazolonepropionase-like amidohydrolase|uniref:metal-dependent hydrolase family protein n=1 Tax=Caldisphaera sp. TaxID=2060322 RepID=UPI000CB0017F|nr:MAG: amidohydrolase family protein [Caldisphaera sp.]